MDLSMINILVPILPSVWPVFCLLLAQIFKCRAVKFFSFRRFQWGFKNRDWSHFIWCVAFLFVCRVTDKKNRVTHVLSSIDQRRDTRGLLRRVNFTLAIVEFESRFHCNQFSILKILSNELSLKVEAINSCYSNPHPHPEEIMVVRMADNIV